MRSIFLGLLGKRLHTELWFWQTLTNFPPKEIHLYPLMYKRTCLTKVFVNTARHQSLKILQKKGTFHWNWQRQLSISLNILWCQLASKWLWHLGEPNYGKYGWLDISLGLLFTIISRYGELTESRFSVKKAFFPFFLFFFFLMRMAYLIKFKCTAFIAIWKTYP